MATVVQNGCALVAVVIALLFHIGCVEAERAPLTAQEVHRARYGERMKRLPKRPVSAKDRHTASPRDPRHNGLIQVEDAPDPAQELVNVHWNKLRKRCENKQKNKVPGAAFCNRRCCCLHGWERVKLSDSTREQCRKKWMEVVDHSKSCNDPGSFFSRVEKVFKSPHTHTEDCDKQGGDANKCCCQSNYIVEGDKCAKHPNLAQNEATHEDEGVDGEVDDEDESVDGEADDEDESVDGDVDDGVDGDVDDSPNSSGIDQEDATRGADALEAKLQTTQAELKKTRDELRETRAKYNESVNARPQWHKMADAVRIKEDLQKMIRSWDPKLSEDVTRRVDALEAELEKTQDELRETQDELRETQAKYSESVNARPQEHKMTDALRIKEDLQKMISSWVIDPKLPEDATRRVDALEAELEKTQAKYSESVNAWLRTFWEKTVESHRITQGEKSRLQEEVHKFKSCYDNATAALDFAETVAKQDSHHVKKLHDASKKFDEYQKAIRVVTPQELQDRRSLDRAFNEYGQNVTDHELTVAEVKARQSLCKDQLDKQEASLKALADMETKDKERDDRYRKAVEKYREIAKLVNYQMPSPISPALRAVALVQNKAGSVAFVQQKEQSSPARRKRRGGGAEAYEEEG